MPFDLSPKEVYFRVREVRGDRKIIVTHYFRPPTADDWISYFMGTSELGLSKGRDTFEISDVMQRKNEDLWGKLIVRVEGYTYGKKDLMERDDWRELIPLPHKLEAVRGFMQFVREDVPTEDSLIEVDSLDLAEGAIELSFTAFQNGQFFPVKVYFKNPESEDYIKFNRISSKMQLVRTRQRNVSAIRVPTDIRPLIKLFDRLAERVEGYIYDGKDVMEQADWRNKVDAFHKKEAVRELFTASLEESEGKGLGE